MSAPTETVTTVSLDDPPVLGSFVSGVVLTFGTRLLMMVGVFGSGVIVARWLGDEGFGTYAVLSVMVALAVQIGSAGLPSANTFFLARDRTTLGPVFANALVFGLIVGGVLAVGVLGLNWIRPSVFGKISTQLVAVAAVSIPFQLLILLGLNILLAIDRIRQLNLFDALLPGWVFANAVVVLIVLRERLFTLVFANTGAAIVLGLLLALYIGREVSKLKQPRKARVDFQLSKAMLRYGVKFYVSIMAAAIIFRADVLIVNRFRGPAEAGVYAVASQFSFLLLMLPGVIATLLFPRVASSPDKTGEFAVRLTRHTTMIMLILCSGAVAISFVLPLIYGAPFADATVQLLMLLPGIFFMGLESVLVQHFTGTGLPRAIPVFWLITLVFNIGLNLVVVPAFGGRGAAVTSSLTYALIFALVAVYFCRKTKRGLGEIFLWRSDDLRALRRMAGASSQEHHAVSAAVENENLWGYRKRLQFVLGVMREAFPGQFPRALRVLDVGCGNGSQLALPLARHGVAVTGVDTDAKSIAHARELARGTRSARFETTSVNELSEGVFDVVILSEVLEHVNNPREFLHAAVKHLTEGGVVIVTTPNGFGEFEWDSWLFRLLRAQKVVDAMVRSHPPPLAATDNDSSGHIQFFTQRRLFKIFSSCGLKVWRAQAATLFAGPFAGHSVARSQRFVEWNARVADKLPMALASGWYFALRRIGPEASQ